MNNNRKTKNTLKPLKNHRIKEEMKYKNNSISMRSDENKKYELIGKWASIKTCRCDDCNKKHFMPSDKRICKICGRIYYKNNGGCENEFC